MPRNRHENPDADVEMQLATSLDMVQMLDAQLGLPTSLMLSMPQCLHIHSRPLVFKFFTGPAYNLRMD